jgi:hypothetical protein
MRKWVLSVVALCLIALAIPLAASAGGWAGSRYDKSECTYTKESNFLFCQSTFTVENFTTEILSFADETCASGIRRISRTGTFVEPFMVFDSFEGRVPLEKYSIGGNESPTGPGVWVSFTDTDLGCAPES